MKIGGLKVKKIEDSRREETIEVVLSSEVGDFNAKIPSGKSRGKKEAAAVDVKTAQNISEELLEELKDKDFTSITELDRFLIEKDGTLNKEKIGGNVMLGVSLSFARAIGKEREQELWEVLREEFFPGQSSENPPLIFSNVINGGAHAKNNLDIQEYQVVVRPGEPIKITIDKLAAFYNELGGKLCEVKDVKDIPLGDEKGYAPNFKDNFEPIEILGNLIEELGLYKSYSVGLDAAASNFQKDGQYNFDGKACSSEDLTGIYKKYFEDSELLTSIEDPFGEDDPESFKKLSNSVPGEKIIIGDDLTVTSPALIRKYADGTIDGVIIKPNQIGTVTEACEALHTAKERGIYRIVSHRSGEVDDAFLVHFAKASDAEGIKIGVPYGERMVKFKELLRLYQ